MLLDVYIPNSKAKEVTTMVILNGGIALLMALSFAVNTAVGMLILLHCPHVMWPVPIRWRDCLRQKPDLKTTEKGETEHEQGLD